jgi:hypothetical protein
MSLRRSLILLLSGLILSFNAYAKNGHGVPNITVLISAQPSIIEPAGHSTLSVSLNGDPTKRVRVRWRIASGGGSLSADRGLSVNYTANGVSAGTTVVIKAKIEI